jgi:hypothetical protein
MAKSPSEEFLDKMGPPRPPAFMLPSAADPQKDAVRVMNIGSTRPVPGPWLEVDKATYERSPPTLPPAPTRVHCDGQPPVCSMRQQY